MKYSFAIAALAAVVFALPQQDSTITSAPAPTPSLDPATASLVSCVNKCDASDVTCKAQCVGVARPNSSQAVETNECAAKCDQGDGSPAATEAYAKCQAACFESLFPSTQTVAPFAPGSPSSGAAPSGSAAPTQSGGNSPSAGSTPSGTGAQSTNASGSPTASGAQASGSSAANSNSAKILGAGLAGFMAIFAL